MKLRQIGNTPLKVSTVGLGCNNFGLRIDRGEPSRAVIHKALDLGITFFDTADVYGHRGGSETALGQYLGVRRKDIVVASKFGNVMDDAGLMKGASRRYIVSAVEASLKRLKTDWIDIYQLHRFDPRSQLLAVGLSGFRFEQHMHDAAVGAHRLVQSRQCGRVYGVS